MNINYLPPSPEEETRPVRIPPNTGYQATQPFGPYEQDQGSQFTQPIEHFQPVAVPSKKPPRKQAVPKKPRRRGGCCGCFAGGLLLTVLVVTVLYFLFPARTNILILGIDRALEGTDASRTDTNIILSVNPLKPIVNMLSIPRDLWVNIPDVGENRINTAHYFAELNDPGSGPYAAMETIEQNFGIQIDYYARIRFDGVKEVVTAMGGLTIDFPEDMSGYEAGRHTLDGDQALAFVRDRSGADDFYRMQHGQLAVKAMIKQLFQPSSWPKLPAVIVAALQTMDFDIPVWQMPRLGLALVRAVTTDNLNNQTITREMVTPFTTSGGAAVLGPNWDLINPLLLELFGQ